MVRVRAGDVKTRQMGEAHVHVHFDVLIFVDVVVEHKCHADVCTVPNVLYCCLLNVMSRRYFRLPTGEQKLDWTCTTD